MSAPGLTARASSPNQETSSTASGSTPPRTRPATSGRFRRRSATSILLNGCSLDHSPCEDDRAPLLVVTLLGRNADHPVTRRGSAPHNFPDSLGAPSHNIGAFIPHLFPWFDEDADLQQPLRILAVRLRKHRGTSMSSCSVRPFPSREPGTSSDHGYSALGCYSFGAE